MASQFVLSLGLLAITCSVAFASDNSHLQDFCIAGNTSNAVGSKVTVVNVAQFSGLNTFGISMAHVDYASLGINPPRIHPRATEILIAIEGSLQVGKRRCSCGCGYSDKHITATVPVAQATLAAAQAISSAAAQATSAAAPAALGSTHTLKR
ncbi:hypothetical protein ACSBR1_040629 [Camellia fascicularis]